MEISKKENRRQTKKMLQDLQMVVDDLERKNDSSLDGRLALREAREHLYVAKDWAVQEKVFKAREVDKWTRYLADKGWKAGIKFGECRMQKVTAANIDYLGLSDKAKAGVAQFVSKTKADPDADHLPQWIEA